MNKWNVFLLGLATSLTHAEVNNSHAILALNETQNSSVMEKKTETILPHQAATLLADKQAVILDVREESEWKQKHIPGAIHIPLGQLKNRLSELEQYKQTPLITQCRTGRRSLQALKALKSVGFSKVYNLEGGIVAWEKALLETQ